MHEQLRSHLDRNGLVVHRREVSTAWMLEAAVRRGELVRVFPGTYVDAAVAGDPEVLLRAALRYTGAGAALSHTSGLTRWPLPAPPILDAALHVTIGRERHLRTGPGLIVHRKAGFVAEPPSVLIHGGVPCLRLETCLVQSWPLLRADPAPDVARAPLIVAVRERLTTPDRLRAELRDHPRLPSSAALHGLLDLLAAGCHSELEVWGHAHVFDHPALPPSRAQRPVSLGGRVVYLDRAYEAELVDVELDGAAYHGTRAQRRADERRDAALAALGWLSVRIGHDRLHRETDAVRRDLVAILATRRRQFGLR